MYEIVLDEYIVIFDCLEISGSESGAWINLSKTNLKSLLST